MEETMNRLLVVMGLAISMWACGGSPFSPTSPSAPLAPTAPSAPVAQPTYTLSGVVSEVTSTGLASVEGVQVEEYTLHQFATTDANGFYRISGVSAGRVGVGFDKEGYQSTRTTVIVSGDTRFDAQVVRR
jgi:hypothetical protein